MAKYICPHCVRIIYTYGNPKCPYCGLPLKWDKKKDPKAKKVITSKS